VLVFLLRDILHGHIGPGQFFRHHPDLCVAVKAKQAKRV
jgi:hypothetical protein